MKRNFSLLLCAALIAFATSGDVLAERKNRQEAKKDLAAVCPQNKIQQIGSTFFWKNNKPIRASSAINAPVIGNNPVMTLAGQPGRGRGLFGSKAVLLASDGTPLASMVPYPCRSDHCGGRVVSSLRTGSARRAALKATSSPSGYVKLSGGVCVFIPDIGRCYGAHVDMTRPLCDRTVK